MIKQRLMNRFTWKIFIPLPIMMLIYLIISLYFVNHFFFNTVINGIDFSLKAHDEADYLVSNYTNGYQLQLIERNGETQAIAGQAIQMQYNKENGIPEVLHQKNPLKWIGSLFEAPNYYVSDLFVYDADALDCEISGLNCLNKDIIEPQNVSFRYSNGSYQVVKEVQGNKIVKDQFHEAIKASILNGERTLNLEEKLCYENPKYTVNSAKTPETLQLLNHYVSAHVSYQFDDEYEMLSGDHINAWLTVDENLDVVIDQTAVANYIKELGKKYDTVGIKRNFKTSVGKVIEIEGGLYGWKIDLAVETEALLKNIELGETIEKEPIYAQRALFSGPDEIGGTYVEVSITRQYLWFYKEGALMAQGPVVTGNPNRGNATVTGTYMLNYKQKGAILRGADYASKVTYWMPFFGNMGIHDASWRGSFGGQIYKSNGTHGCINTPFYLAKTIFHNIEEGIPIIIYKE